MKTRQHQVKKPYAKLSKRCRARLLSINLSSCYLTPKPVSSETVTLMNEIQDIYSARPFQGYRRITYELKIRGYAVNHKKVYRLMNQLGIQAIYPKKNFSKRNMEHKVYPYLLKQHPPLKVHDAWCVDITYIKLKKGFVYLTALIDVVSRCVMGYHLSTCLGTESSLMALEMAIATGYKPVIINSDQGCQFTSQEWLYSLSLLNIRVSMDGKGRAIDNIPIERFWRTLKYEEVYLKSYENVEEARKEIMAYIQWYNHQRPHSRLDKLSPWNVMSQSTEGIEASPYFRADVDISDTNVAPPISKELEKPKSIAVKQLTANTEKVSSKKAA